MLYNNYRRRSTFLAILAVVIRAPMNFLLILQNPKRSKLAMGNECVPK